MEYTLPPAAGALPPAFLFVVDTALPPAELCDAADSVQQAASLLPDGARVGLLSFSGAVVYVHELGGATAADAPRAWALRGDADAAAYEPDRLHAQLGLGGAGRGRAQGGGGGGGPAPRPGAPGAAPPAWPPGGCGAASGASRFVAPLSECEFALSVALECLVADPPPPPATRPARCTGAAVAVALAVAEACGPQGCGARVVLFTGGPCTVGPGRVVGRPRTEALRSHKDFDKDTAQHWGPAVAFYAALAERAARRPTPPESGAPSRVEWPHAARPPPPPPFAPARARWPPACRSTLPRALWTSAAWLS